MEYISFYDFLQAFRDKADEQKLISNIQFVDLSTYIKAIALYLKRYWSFTEDERRGYEKILPVIFYLKFLNSQMKPIKLTINGLLFNFKYCNDHKLTHFPWSDFQIQFVCNVLLTVFKEKSHIDADI